ncbi:MAG: ATP-binding protein [Elusimicrobiales bacterium]|nr:ATP-binding protein [Elusimicrobiales bacterium]
MEEGMTSSGLEGLDAEIDRLLEEVQSKEKVYSARVALLEDELKRRDEEARALSSRLAEAEKAWFARERELKDSARSLKDALSERDAAAADLALKAEELSKKIASLEKSLEKERNASREKDVYIQSAKSAVKGRDAEVEKIWRMVEEARSEIASWKAQTAERDSRLEAAAAENRALALEIQKLNNSLQQAAQGFRHKLDLVKKEAEAAVLEKSSALVRISAAEEAMNERAASMEKLAARARQLEETLAVRESRLAELEDRLKFFETAPQSAEKASAETAALRRKERLVSELTARVAALEKDLTSAEEDRARLAERVHASEAGLRSAREELAGSSARIKALESERDSFKKLSAEAQEMAAAISEKAGKEDTEKLSRIAESLRQEHARYSQALSRAEELSTRCAELEADYGALRKRHDDAMAEKAAEIEKLRSDLAQAEAEGARRLSELAEADRRRYHELAGEMQQLSSRLAEKEMELEAARSGHEAIKAECARLREHERELHKNYERQLKDDNRLLDEARSAAAKLEGELHAIHSRESALKAEAEALKAEIDLSRREKSKAASSGKKLKELESRLKEKNDELAEARRSLSKISTEKERWMERERKLSDAGKGGKARAELAEAERRLAAKEQELAEVSDRLEAAAAEISGLRAARESFRGRTAPGPSADLQELVAGIAHQISNSVSIIRSHAEYCLEAPREADLKEPLGAIVRSIVTLQKRIEEIADFSRPVLLQRKTVGLGEIAKEALAYAAAAPGQAPFQSKVSAPRDLPPLRVDQVRLQEALEHVLVNAAESLGRDGRITVDIRRSSGGQVIKVSDNGQGVEPKNLPAVFEPFFSTKPGKLGLGLAIAKNIIKSHGGEIKLSSEFGRGTQAEIFLPDAPEEG